MGVDAQNNTNPFPVMCPVLLQYNALFKHWGVWTIKLQNGPLKVSFTFTYFTLFSVNPASKHRIPQLIYPNNEIVKIMNNE